MRTSLYRNNKSKRKLYPTAPRSQHGAAVRCSCRPAPQKSWSTSCPRLTSPTARTTASARTAAQRRWDNVTGHINTNVMPVRIIGCGNAKRLWTLCKNRKNWIWSCALGWKMMRQGWLFLSAWTLTPAWKPPHRNMIFFQFNEMTNEMDLWSTVNGETVGQFICQNLYGNFVMFIHNSYVRICHCVCKHNNSDKQFDYTGLTSILFIILHSFYHVQFWHVISLLMNIFFTQVHAYYEVCGGPWEYAGLDSQQMLCCSLGQHEHCISRWYGFC